MGALTADYLVLELKVLELANFSLNLYIKKDAKIKEQCSKNFFSLTIFKMEEVAAIIS